MQVSIDTILAKMAKEIATTQQYKHDSQKVREHITAIRTLCELLLDEHGDIEVAPRVTPAPAPALTPAQMPLSSRNAYAEEDGANGTSLLDF
ncbi:YwdI family protein [Microbacteriaceae bacterium 4G12]